MSRRKRIVIASAGLLLLLFVGTIVGSIMYLRSTSGRERVRAMIHAALDGSVNGSVYIGQISDDFFTGVTIDSFAIYDPDDSLFIATGPVTVKYDLRDLFDRRILLSNVRAERPVVYLRQHQDGEWNFRHVFSRDSEPAESQQRGFGDIVVIDDAHIVDGTFLLTTPWNPRPALRGAQRDSAIRHELARTDIEIRRTSEGIARTRRWTNIDALVAHARLRYPDSTGTSFRIAKLSANESDPPFQFSNVHGTVEQRGDSVWVNLPHFDLPASTGSGYGKIVWGSDLPVRYDLHVIGDSVSMQDVAWIYPTLPTTGGGKTVLDIRSQPDDPQLIDYILTSMDLRTTRSRLQGAMTFVLGQDTLGVKDVDLIANPVNFDLLRTLNGEPFPYDWQGDITGRVKASGGNIARFRVEDAELAFADANVPGAVARGHVSGMLNIYDPALAVFHGVTVQLETFDLRTPQFLNSAFPVLQGTVSGQAVLDSIWTDVRFHDADLVHHDGDAEPSRITGSGRVTWGEEYLTYDLDLYADSLAATTIQRSYPYFPLRGKFAGPIRAQGESPSLQVSTVMSNAFGELTYEGEADMDPPILGGRGTGSFRAANLRGLFANNALPPTSLNGEFTVDAAGDSILTLQGLVAATVSPSYIISSDTMPVQVPSANLTLRFDRGRVFVDTLVVHTSQNKLDAYGVVALRPEFRDTLHYRVDVDSVAELNALLERPFSEVPTGTGIVIGRLTGSLDSLATDATIDAHNVAMGSARAGRLEVSANLQDLTRTPAGTVTLQADSLAPQWLPFETVASSLRIYDPKRADFTVQVSGKDRDDLTGVTTGSIAIADSSISVDIRETRITIDTTDTYTLTAPVHIVADATSLSADAILLSREQGGSAALRNVRLAGDSVQGSLRTEAMDFSMFQLLAPQLHNLAGDLTANIDVSGVRSAPQFHGAITLADGRMTVPAAGATFHDVTANIELAGETVRILQLSAETENERRGVMSLSGEIGFASWNNPTFDLTATASNFNAIDRRGLASLDVSTSQPLSLTGAYSDATLRGGIFVNRGTVYIPEVVRKRVIDINDPELYDVIDTTLDENRALLPSAPTRFARGLRMENVGVTIGDDVWLRSDEANIKLGGSLNVTVSSVGVSEPSQMALQGVLRAERGTYRLNVVPFIQPIFEVESGTLRFFGTPGLDPAIEITAINTVRKPQQSVMHQDVRIRATIGGTLTSPTLDLSSADNLPLTQSDLLSYLITGEPAFALDYTSQTYVNQLAAVAIRSAGNVLTSAIPRSLFDVVELQTAGAQDPTSSTTQLENPTLYNLLNTRAVFGKQLNSNLFLNFSTGFCTENFRSNLGFRLEYRFSRVYRILFGLEPGSSELTCTRSSAAQTIQQTPPQFGLDFFRTWRF